MLYSFDLILPCRYGSRATPPRQPVLTDNNVLYHALENDRDVCSRHATQSKKHVRRIESQLTILPVTSLEIATGFPQKYDAPVHAQCTRKDNIVPAAIKTDRRIALQLQPAPKWPRNAFEGSRPVIEHRRAMGRRADA
jgi:hypothetical protein